PRPCRVDRRLRRPAPPDRRRRELRALDRRGPLGGARRVRRLRGGSLQAMTVDHVLTLLLVVPAVGIVPLLLFRDPRAAKQIAIVTTFVELVLSLAMLAQFHVGEADFQLTENVAWLPTLGIRYFVGVDGISVLLVPMTTLL